MNRSRKFGRLSSFQIILAGFAALILLGALILMLPFAAKDGESTPFSDALFTAVSAVCVTGLVVLDTATHWSAFGQAVILVLIQIGGLGVVTVAIAALRLSGRKIGLKEKSTAQEAVSAPSVGEVVGLTGFILKVTLIAELLGALALLPVFCTRFGAKGIWMAVFHSVSAFCNAGFDILGESGAFSSLTDYAADPAVNLIVMALIFAGGIGFLVWEDVVKHKWRFKEYRLQSKVALVASGVLVLLPAIYFFFAEFSAFPVGERIWRSLFQAVTPRTAGFNTSDLAALGGVGQALTVFLMLVGGSPGSTAGGFKTTTLAVLFASALSVSRKKEDVELGGRRVPEGTLGRAAALLCMYLTLFFIGGSVISLAEGLPLSVCLFESASALGTVGLSLGVTPALGTAARIVLIALMFIGRAGGMTCVYAAFGGGKRPSSRLPAENIAIG